MSGYIDKDFLLKQINSFISTEKHTDYYNCGYDDCICDVQDTIEDMPEANVVEVVRCKDCKYCEAWDYFGKTCYRCIGKWDISGATCADITLDDYCSYAERKDEE